MFEPISLHTLTDGDGHLRVDLPLDLPPNSEVQLLVSAPKKAFATQVEWEAHVDRIAGSIPDLERPGQWPVREIAPL